MTKLPGKLQAQKKSGAPLSSGPKNWSQGGIQKKNMQPEKENDVPIGTKSKKQRPSRGKIGERIKLRTNGGKSLTGHQ